MDRRTFFGAAAVGVAASDARGASADPVRLGFIGLSGREPQSVAMWRRREIFGRYWSGAT